MKTTKFFTIFVMVFVAFAFTSCNSFKSVESPIGKGCTKFTAPGPADQAETVFYGVRDGNGHIFIGPNGVTSINYANGIYTYSTAVAKYMLFEGKQDVHYKILSEQDSHKLLQTADGKQMALAVNDKLVVQPCKNIWVYEALVFVQNDQDLWGLRTISGAELLPNAYKGIVAAYQTGPKKFIYLTFDGKVYTKRESASKAFGTLPQAQVTKLQATASKAGKLHMPSMDNSPICCLETTFISKK